MVFVRVSDNHVLELFGYFPWKLIIIIVIDACGQTTLGSADWCLAAESNL